MTQRHTPSEVVQAKSQHVIWIVIGHLHACEIYVRGYEIKSEASLAVLKGRRDEIFEEGCGPGHDIVEDDRHQNVIELLW